jgi:rare lipoprotein A
VFLSRSTSTLMAVTAILGACTGDGSQEQMDTSPVAELTAEQIAHLEERYPRLGEDPLPQPEPAPAARPGRVPERIATRVPEAVLETITGQATFYANSFEGRRTASGIPFRQNQLVAAHRAYPFGTILRVTNLGNNRSINVRVVDRGPFGASAARGTVIDLSRRAAENLGFTGAGRARVRVDVLEWGRGIGA